jgi:molybdenum cofactor cytidylyltransferase
MPRDAGHGAGVGAAAVILAAGQSSRMGSRKPLLDWEGMPLVRRAAQAALEGGYAPVIVVTSHPAEDIERALAGLPVSVVVNERASEGVGTSIAVGLGALGTEVDWAALMLCDQPFVRPSHLAALRMRAATAPLMVVASSYEGTVGVPALFARAVFARLLSLDPAEGCKRIIHALSGQAAFVDCPEAAVDLDTPAEYERARSR